MSAHIKEPQVIYINPEPYTTVPLVTHVLLRDIQPHNLQIILQAPFFSHHHSSIILCNFCRVVYLISK